MSPKFGAIIAAVTLGTVSAVGVSIKALAPKDGCVKRVGAPKTCQRRYPGKPDIVRDFGLGNVFQASEAVESGIGCAPAKCEVSTSSDEP